MAIKRQRGSGHVFANLGFAVENAVNLQRRSDLIIQLRTRLVKLGVTQAQAAPLLGVSPPRVNDLTRGRIDRFSMDTLIKLLGKLGVEVRVTTRARSRAA